MRLASRPSTLRQPSHLFPSSCHVNRVSKALEKVERRGALDERDKDSISGKLSAYQETLFH